MQPLWAKDNIRKSNNLPKQSVIDYYHDLYLKHKDTIVKCESCQ